MPVATQSVTLRGTSLLQQQPRQPRAAVRPVQTAALFGKKSSTAVVEKPPAKKKGAKQTIEERQGAFGRVISALDFAEVRSESDAELLYQAKYGKRTSDGKMTRAQYGALRRRVGGTAKDYWKDWVDVKGDYVEKGYVSKDRSAVSNSVSALPFLLAVVVALFGATAFVVAQTS